ncbi:MAG: hypothetical protein GC181_13310 [Bacteroidetes bacterium]|nr:hypothetical protein [Bacteroidota bacterium]
MASEPLPEIALQSNILIPVKGRYYIGDSLANGIYFLPGKEGDTIWIKSIRKGRADGIWKSFYPNHRIEEQRVFINGLKEGELIQWWPNGQLKLKFNFLHDEYEGTCRAWNQNGVLISEMNYHRGHEEGSQKVWYDDGKIKSNYVVKNGRRYGMLGTKNCINVSDSLY